jgi:hypothetical protein
VIAALVSRIREHVVDPQATDPTPAERRVYADAERAPIAAALRTAEVVPVSTTPVGAELGPSGRLMLRHLVAVMVTVEDAAVSDADAIRDLVVLDFARRIVTVDWPNVPLEDGHDIVRLAWDVDYTDYRVGELAAWFSLRFTIDTEWKV